MEEKLKYYTPKIEEFFVGFEYEYLDTEDVNRNRHWNLKSYDGYDIEDIEYKMEQLKEIRVKYLDKTDIESLGFSLYQNLNTDHSFEWHIEDKDNVNIGMFFDDYENKCESNIELIGAYFKIKNKSEFKKLLNQMGLL